MNFNDFMDWEDRKAKVNDYVDSFVGMCPESKDKLRKEKLEALKENVLNNIIE